MSAVTLTTSDFDSTLKENNLVLVDFWADWCGPCKVLSPVVEEIATEYEEKLLTGKVDVDSNPEIASRFSIRGIPTLILFKNGEPVNQIVGAVDKSKITSMINKEV